MDNPIVSLVITTINPSSKKSLRIISQGCKKSGWQCIIVGDQKTPKNFFLEGCDYYSLDQQQHLNLEYSKRCPPNHYSRKNIGYLLSMLKGSNIIIETDDDNIPLDTFWELGRKRQRVGVNTREGWVNVYQHFKNNKIWPRGFPLQELKNDTFSYDSSNFSKKEVCSPIQQNLVNGDPDVDAVYRLLFPLSIEFNEKESIALSEGSWCPFNSQNTTWWKEAFALMYLPSTCSFRMTDIWRSFIAQRIIWEKGWKLIFNGASMKQERNHHDLLKDFQAEIPGYLYNNEIRKKLEDIALQENNVRRNLKIVYRELIEESYFEREELTLLNAWLEDLESILQ